MSRWAWLGCEDCRTINDALARAWGFRPLALGRHSLMNGISIRAGASPEVVQRALVSAPVQLSSPSVDDCPGCGVDLASADDADI
jgi:hypothetical protein